MPSDAVAIGLDVGGTKLAGGVVSEEGRLLERVRMPFRTGGTQPLASQLADLVEGIDEGRGLLVGVGFAGIVTRDGVVRYGPNVRVADLPLGSELEERLGVAVAVLNDATAAAWGERQAGAARGIDDVVMLTLGTGVGGGLVVGGRLVEGAHGFAAELGHVVVEDGGRRCPCGNHGCLEAYASGTAIAVAARERLEEAGEDASTLGGRAVTGEAVVAAAAEDDDVAVAVLTEAGRWLGVGLTSLVNALDPARVVVGGGAVAGTGPWMLPAAREVVASRILGADHREPPEIVEAELGNDAGVVGAALWAAERS